MGERILIVDDNPANLKLARVLLTSEGYEVKTAADAEEALAALKTFIPRLILMDIQLPGMDGLALTRRLKADPATAGITILAMTAYAMKGDDEKALAAGCDGYVSKPIDTRRLPGVVARYLGTAPGPEVEAEPEAGEEGDSAIDPSRRARLLELARRDGNSFLDEMVQLFASAATESIERMQRGAAAADPADLDAGAHRLGGSAANVGASKLARLCAEVSAAAAAEAPPLVERIRQELARVETELRAIARQAG